MFEHEVRFLQESYLRRGITIEQYEVRQDALHEFCSEWRAHFGKKDTDQELLHFMRTRRKRGLWVRFDGTHQAAPDLPVLTAEQKETLIDVYYEYVADQGNGSDTLGYDQEITELISKEFEHRTRRNVSGPMLVGILTALRKRGLLPKVREQSNEEDIGGFDDISAAG